MRRYTSVLMLGARGVVMPLIAVLLLMSAADKKKLDKQWKEMIRKGRQ